MVLLNAHQLNYAVPGRTLLENVDLSLVKGQKSGLVGRNGSGKSTLLKLLSGDLTPDSGDLTLRSGTQIRYLAQLPDLEQHESSSLRDIVLQGAPEVLRWRSRYQELCQILEDNSDSKLEKEFNELTDRLNARNGWELETRADTLLTTMGFSDPERLLSGLSGGEVKRVALAQSLLLSPDILFLDEPTNHLDIATIAWLEKFLVQARFAVLMVTHDRFFLERVCESIYEVADLGIHHYSGNYSKFLELKAEREATKEKQQARFENVLRQETAWLRQGPKARSTKQKARKERILAMLDTGSGISKAQGQIDDQAWDLGTRRLGKKAIHLDVRQHKILKTNEFRLAPGERVGLVGANGSGKTTFLRLLAGVEAPQDGRVEIGETVSVGFFDQHTDRLKDLPPKMRVLDAVKDVATSIPLKGGKELTAARLCELFLFQGTQQSTPIERLSGGERKRLELLRILMERPNVIIADEPTNDLDIETLSRLEFFFENFPGCVCIASHDRFLLQRLSDRLLIFDDGRSVERSPSVLDDLTPEFFAAGKGRELKKKVNTPVPVVVAAKKKLSYKENHELAKLEEDIPKWEARLQDLSEEIAAKSDSYSAVRGLLEEQQELEKCLELGLERWAALEELKESLS